MSKKVQLSFNHRLSINSFDEILSKYLGASIEFPNEPRLKDRNNNSRTILVTKFSKNDPLSYLQEVSPNKSGNNAIPGYHTIRIYHANHNITLTFFHVVLFIF